MNVGEWKIWCGNHAHFEKGGWRVVHQQGPYSRMVWGPFPTKEEAIEKSGMPAPKTELEEVWEAAKELREVARRAKNNYLRFNKLYIDTAIAIDHYDMLASKYNKA